MNLDITFCVFHVGDTKGYVSAHVASLRRFYPNARIVFLTDEISCIPLGVDESFRFSFPSRSLMVSRIFAYQQFKSSGPTFYLDCDLFPVSVMPLALLEKFNSKNILCRRYFSKDAIFNHSFAGNDYSIYKGMTLDQVFPILACFTYSESNVIWREVMSIISGLNDSFHAWYGDQEALKKWAINNSSSNNMAFVSEQVVACLPEFDFTGSYFVHFKGESRKKLLPSFLSEYRL